MWSEPVFVPKPPHIQCYPSASKMSSNSYHKDVNRATAKRERDEESNDSSSNNHPTSQVEKPVVKRPRPARSAPIVFQDKRKKGRWVIQLNESSRAYVEKVATGEVQHIGRNVIAWQFEWSDQSQPYFLVVKSDEIFWTPTLSKLDPEVRMQHPIARRGRREQGSSPTSAFVGVSWKSREHKWVVQIRNKGIQNHVGQFSEEVIAAIAYDIHSFMLRGFTQKFNFPSMVIGVVDKLLHRAPRDNSTATFGQRVRTQTSSVHSPPLRHTIQSEPGQLTPETLTQLLLLQQQQQQQGLRSDQQLNIAQLICSHLAMSNAAAAVQNTAQIRNTINPATATSVIRNSRNTPCVQQVGPDAWVLHGTGSNPITLRKLSSHDGSFELNVPQVLKTVVQLQPPQSSSEGFWYGTTAGSTGYIGVVWNGQRHKWLCTPPALHQQSFDDPSIAAIAYDLHALGSLEWAGQDTELNFPELSKLVTAMSSVYQNSIGGGVAPQLSRQSSTSTLVQDHLAAIKASHQVVSEQNAVTSTQRPSLHRNSLVGGQNLDLKPSILGKISPGVGSYTNPLNTLSARHGGLDTETRDLSPLSHPNVPVSSGAYGGNRVSEGMGLSLLGNSPTKILKQFREDVNEAGWQNNDANAFALNPVQRLQSQGHMPTSGSTTMPPAGSVANSIANPIAHLMESLRTSQLPSIARDLPTPSTATINAETLQLLQEQVRSLLQKGNSH